MVEFQCPHCDLIFPDIGSVKIHIHNAHKDVRHKYAEVNKNDAANNFNRLSTSTDIPQPDRTTARLSRHGVSVDKVRDRSLLRQGDRHRNPNIAPNRQGDHHGSRKHGKDEFKVTNF